MKKQKTNSGEPQIGGHYFLSDQLNYIYCFACLGIVLENSEKAREIFEEINKCWELPGCKDLINRIGIYLQSVGFYKGVLKLSGINLNEDNDLTP